MVVARGDEALIEQLESGSFIARGNGRAYGDSAIGAATTIDMRHRDKMLSFAADDGVLVAEAGVLLAEVIATFLPRGWFPAVTPGTKFVTLGGMIAADVHGKNHHRDGGMRSCVEWVDLLCVDGKLHRCSRTQNTDLFDWTLGGMGLTGVIVRAAIKLRPIETGWIRQRTLAAPDLASAMAIFEDNQSATYSVAWIDCLASGRDRGRSVVMLGEHATNPDIQNSAKADDPFALHPKKSVRVPIDLPASLLNQYSVKLFNKLYYWKHIKGASNALVSWDSFFYPLDSLLEWNRIYGKRGFAQFQCVIPLAAAQKALEDLLDRIAMAGQGSFLAVLKRMGAGGTGISFGMPGYTLALDFPISDDALKLIAELEQIAIDHGGRFYLAKDACLSALCAKQADPRLAAFAERRSNDGTALHFASLQSRRLEL